MVQIWAVFQKSGVFKVEASFDAFFSFFAMLFLYFKAICNAGRLN